MSAQFISYVGPPRKESPVTVLKWTFQFDIPCSQQTEDGAVDWQSESEDVDRMIKWWIENPEGPEPPSLTDYDETTETSDQASESLVLRGIDDLGL
jgi:hypothetical protein